MPSTLPRVLPGAPHHPGRTGSFVGYCQPRPRAVKLDGRQVPFVHDAQSGMLTVPMQRTATPAELSLWFAQRVPSSG